MKSIHLLVFLCCIQLLSAQDVSQIIEFDLNNITDQDHIVLYDVSATHCVLKVNSNDFSLANGFSYSNPEAQSVLLFCDANLNVIWYKSVVEDNFGSDIGDAVLGEDAVYVFGRASGLWIIEEPDEIHSGTIVGKIGFDGNVDWMRSYSGTQRLQAREESLALDSQENLFLGTHLLNYEHPIQPDSLFFASDTCRCSAFDMQFPYCITTLKWDSNGNELWYHVLDSEEKSFTLSIGIDVNDQCFVSGKNASSIEPPEFAGNEINGGNFVLCFAPNGSEKWVYIPSPQGTIFDSTMPFFLFSDEISGHFGVVHDENMIFYGTDTIEFEIPVPGFVDYNTIHQIDKESGELIEVDLFGYFSSFTRFGVKNQNVPFVISGPHPGFTHSFPPFTYEPNPSEMIILSKTVFGDYSEPITFMLPQGVSGSFIASDLIYLELQQPNDEPISFTLDGTEYTTGTSNCVVVLDMSNEVQQVVKQPEVILYPNPVAGDILMVQTDVPIQRIDLHDLQGKVVLSNFEPIAQINVSSLAPGMYLARIYGSSDVQVVRVMVW